MRAWRRGVWSFCAPAPRYRRGMDAHARRNMRHFMHICAWTGKGRGGWRPPSIRAKSVTDAVVFIRLTSHQRRRHLTVLIRNGRAPGRVRVLMLARHMRSRCVLLMYRVMIHTARASLPKRHSWPSAVGHEVFSAAAVDDSHAPAETAGPMRHCLRERAVSQSVYDHRCAHRYIRT